MGLLDRLKRKRTEISVWEISDKNKFIISMDTIICQKCADGENLDVLSHPEKVFYMVQRLETEVNNGGFSQYFYNTNLDCMNELILAFKEIKAEKTADICKKAIAVFGDTFPKNRSERIADLDKMDSEDAFEKYDELFYEYEDDLLALNYEYIIQHKSDFTG